MEQKSNSPLINSLNKNSQGEDEDIQKIKSSPKLKMRKMQSLIRDFNIIDSSTGIITMSIVNLLNLQNADNILECGCGCEYSLPYICGIKKQSSNLYMTDFSEVKLRKIKQKVKLLEDHPLSQDLYDHKYVPDEEFTEKYVSNKLNVIVEIADATQLQYPSKMFDSYYGGLLLDEVQEPFSIAKEAYRVLKIGGRAGFTIFSEKDDKEYEVYKIIENASIKVLMDNKEKNSEDFSQQDHKSVDKLSEEFDDFFMDDNYYKGSKEKIQDILQNANFQNILIWESFVPVSSFNMNHFNDCFDIYAKDLDWDAQIKSKIFEESRISFLESMDKTNKPFGFTVTCAVAQKL